MVIGTDLKNKGDQMPLLSSRRAKGGIHRITGHLTSVLQKVMEKTFLEIISQHLKDRKVCGSTQQICKGKSGIINLIAFSDEMLAP